jgi:CubicO group peptidase (beta-lactamase class C family)
VKIIFFILFTFGGFTLPVICKSQQLLDDSIASKLKMGVEGFMHRYNSPSIVVAIVHNREVIFSDAKGYIDLENKIPADINSVYSIQSITKVFTATMFMQLVQKGIVAIDDAVIKYVPEFKDNLNATDKNEITLLQLATHTSGLARNSPADIKFAKQIDNWLTNNTSESTITPATKKEFLQSLKFIPKQYPEYHLLSYGDRHYSNLGYSLLGIALERAAKTDYAGYIIKNICQPLKMDNSSFSVEKNNTTAKGYFYKDSLKQFIKTPTFIANSAMPAGGMYASAIDLAKFISFQLDNNSENTNTILSERNRAMMQVFNIAWKPAYPLVFHEGAMLGYRCVIVLNPELKVGWVILTNTTDFDFSRMNTYINQLITPVFAKKAITDLDKYTGTYKLSGGYDSLKIYLNGESLYSTYLQNILPDTPLISLGENRFKGQTKNSHNIVYEFISDNGLEVKALNLGQLMWMKQ